MLKVTVNRIWYPSEKSFFVCYLIRNHKKSIYHCKVYKVYIINTAKTFWFWWVCQPLYLKLTVFASLNFPPLHYCRPPNKWKDITQQIKGQERVGGFFNIFVSSWENLLWSWAMVNVSVLITLRSITRGITFWSVNTWGTFWSIFMN